MAGIATPVSGANHGSAAVPLPVTVAVTPNRARICVAIGWYVPAVSAARWKAPMARSGSLANAANWRPTRRRPGRSA